MTSVLVFPFPLLLFSTTHVPGRRTVHMLMLSRYRLTRYDYVIYVSMYVSLGPTPSLGRLSISHAEHTIPPCCIYHVHVGQLYIEECL